MRVRKSFKKTLSHSIKCFVSKNVHGLTKRRTHYRGRFSSAPYNKQPVCISVHSFDSNINIAKL